jgi:hypothetical protein
MVPIDGFIDDKETTQIKRRTPGLLASTNVENSLQFPLSRMLTLPDRSALQMLPLQEIHL